MTFGSLFSGFGGFDIGLERAGMTCAWQCEINPYARRVLARHWPRVPKWDDVRTFIPDPSWGAVDLICGGFPCQPVSLAGKRRGTSDARWLWPEFARIIRVVRPKYVLVENTPGIFTCGFDQVLGDLASLGFDAEWSMLSACAMGAPHTRERVFIVAYADGVLRSTWLGSRRSLRENNESEMPSPWMDSISPLCRGIDGVSNRVERLEGLGNAVVPQVAEWIGRRIVESSLDAIVSIPSTVNSDGI